MTQNLDLSQNPKSNLMQEVEKKQTANKREKIKFIMTLLLSNLCVALIFGHQPKEQLIERTKRTHENHIFLEVPLNSFVDQTLMEKEETPISLVDKQNKIIIHKAYLHEFLGSNNDEKKIYKLEIPKEKIDQLTKALNDEIIAVPEIVEKKVTQKSQGSKYEINF